MASSSTSEAELTMCDVLEEEQELEEDANAVLGGSDDTNCSYDKGYVPRQALYACKTCCPDAYAGICLACCYACHDKHEVVELYTKRNFRCDCGNMKFKGKTCTLTPKKDEINSKNLYNHNFKGVYCICRRPYPDPEDQTPDEMIQCVMCEDWFHARHLSSKVPDEYFEMICKACMESHEFLRIYQSSYDINVEDSPVKNEGTDNPEKTNGVKLEHTDNNLDYTNKMQPIVSSDLGGTNVSLPKNEQTSNEDHIKLENQDFCPSKTKIKEDCILANLQTSNKYHGSAFWPENWRSDLCRCVKCKDMYTSQNCLFLLNQDDTVLAYEESGKSKSQESQYDQGLSALSQLDRVKQMEAIQAYTSMKGELLDYLKDFADQKKTVCERDIKDFFERMTKKRKLENGVPYHCR